VVLLDNDNNPGDESSAPWRELRAKNFAKISLAPEVV
jgi:hypothetical protein